MPNVSASEQPAAVPGNMDVDHGDEDEDEEFQFEPGGGDVNMDGQEIDQIDSYDLEMYSPCTPLSDHNHEDEQTTPNFMDDADEDMQNYINEDVDLHAESPKANKESVSASPEPAKPSEVSAANAVSSPAEPTETSQPAAVATAAVEEAVYKKSSDSAPAMSSDSKPTVNREHVPTGKKMHTSPDEILLPISPPGCRINLSFTDHRFRANWVKDLKCTAWIGNLKNASFSAVFYRDQPDSWQRSLRLVHANAWEKWQIGHAENMKELKLPKGVTAQKPGEIEPGVFTDLEPIVQRMPVPVSYRR